MTITCEGRVTLTFSNTGDPKYPEEQSKPPFTCILSPEEARELYRMLQRVLGETPVHPATDPLWHRPKWGDPAPVDPHTVFHP